MQEGYYGGGYKPQKMSKKQINEMIKNMRKSTIIQSKSKQYHQKEEIEAEAILKKLEKDN